MRKKRSDRNYVLYQLTAGTDTYVGLTVAQGQAFLRSVKVRVQKHLSRAKRENHSWSLYSYLRDNPEVQIQYVGYVVFSVRDTQPMEDGL